MEPDPTREWHFEMEGVRKGPVSERKLLADRELGLLEDSTLVWTSGMDDWAELSSIRFGENLPRPLPGKPSKPEEDEAPVDYSDPLVPCAWSGKKKKQSEMLPFGEVWVAPEHRNAFVQQLAESGKSPDIPLEGYPFPAPLTLETVLGQSFQIFGAQWKAIVILCISIYGPTQLVIELLTRYVFSSPVLDSENPEDLFTFSMLSIWGPASLNLVSGVLIGAFVSAALFSMTWQRWDGRSELEAGGLLRTGVSNFLGVFLTRLILYFLYVITGAVLGLLLFQGATDMAAYFFFAMIAFVIIVFLSVRLTTAEPVSVLERKGGGLALGRSWELTRGNFWRIVGYRLLVLIPIGMISGVVGYILEIPIPVFQNFFAAAVVTTLITIPSAFSSVFEMVLAIHLKARETNMTSKAT